MVRTIVLENAQDANEREVLVNVAKAELVFFAGGDQALYYEWIKNSKLQRILQAKINHRQISIGGTSAGMAILAGIDFVARYGPPRDPNDMVNTQDVLQNPLGEFVDLQNDVLMLNSRNSRTFCWIRKFFPK